MSGSDCFWTDLVRVEQFCDGDTPEPGDTVLAAVLPFADEYGLDFIPFETVACGPVPGISSDYGDGTHYSARYSITAGQFDALSCGDAVNLAGLTREPIYATYCTSDGALQSMPNSKYDSPGILAYDWPAGSCWILEITPADFEEFDVTYIAIAVR